MLKHHHDRTSSAARSGNMYRPPHKMAISNVGLYCSFFLLFVVTSCFCLAGDNTEEENENLQELSVLNNQFALNLHRKLTAGSSENVFFSPFSISTAFAMLFYGARGDTAKELRNALCYNRVQMPDDLVHLTFSRYLTDILNGNSSDEYVLNVANAILLDNHMELEPEYRDAVENLYHASVQNVNFLEDGPALVTDINNWVRQMTKGKINKLLDELSASTVMIILNAIYFKGTWKIQFEKQKTKPQLFFNEGLDSKAKEVPFMHMSARHRYTNFADYQVLELPYKGDRIAMLILLPNQQGGLSALERDLTPEKLLAIQRSMYKTKVIISLPKFKIQYSTELSQVMKELGARKIFEADVANFSGMTPNEGVFVSQVLHKAVVEVNEEGSEAAAVTAIGITSLAVSVELTPEFTVDHPFLFAIVDLRNQLILFMGRVNKL